MVTTFVLDKIIKNSVKYLDNTRVYNQSREAIMAINYILNLYYVANFFNLPLTNNPNFNVIQQFLYNVHWAKTIVEVYKKYCKDNNIQLSYNKITKVYTWQNNNYILQDNEKFLFKGYCNHPAVLAWVGHLNALKDYNNLHREEAINRNFKVETDAYVIEGDIIYPWWVYNDIVIYNYWNNLHWKELVRRENRWYLNFTDKVTNLYKNPIFTYGNLWLAKLDYNTLMSIYKLEYDKLDFSVICDQIKYYGEKNYNPKYENNEHITYILNYSFPEQIKTYISKLHNIT